MTTKPKPGRLIKVFALLLILPAAAYGSVLLWFRWNENSLLFHPERGKVLAAPAELKLQSRDVTFQSADGVVLTARLIPPPSNVSLETAGWILYFHGASGNIGTPGYNEAWAKFRELGLGVLAVDYRGFGESTGQPSEAGFYRDADAAYDYLNRELQVPPSRIVLYGYSLGSAVAIELASRSPAAGLIVEGSLLSVPTRGAELYPYVPVAWLAQNRFASVDKIARVTMPKLFVHARGDTDIPIAHSRQLFALAPAPKLFQDVAGGHTDAYQVDPQFFNAIARFLSDLKLPLATPRVN
jgi:uncharacterized protein